MPHDNPSPADAAAVATVRSLLKPDGIAVISVPAYQWLFGHHDVQLGHYRRYTRRNLLKLFRADFAIEAGRYYGAAFIPIAPPGAGIAAPEIVASASAAVARYNANLPKYGEAASGATKNYNKGIETYNRYVAVYNRVVEEYNQLLASPSRKK